MVETAASGTQSVERAIAILRAVASLQHVGASLAAVTRATGLNRSTTFRLLQSLVEQRMLAFDGSSRQYRVGLLTNELALAGGGTIESLSAPWREPLRRAVRRTGLTAYLVARSGYEVVCLETVEAQTVLRAVPLVPGQRLPLGIGAGSLAILSSLPDDEVSAALDASEPHRAASPAGSLTREELLRRIRATRESGFAYSRQSVAEGVVGLGITLPMRENLIQLAASVSKVGDGIGEAEQRAIVAALREEFARPPADRLHAA